MSARYENIVNLMSGAGPGSSTLEQHCSAMRMDEHHAYVSNQIGYALVRWWLPLSEVQSYGSSRWILAGILFLASPVILIWG